jgi:hypothetical protein
MGSKVKAIVGIAAAIFAPQIAGYMLTGSFAAATGFAAMALTAGVTLVAASIAGSAFTPDSPDIGDLGGVDSHAGVKLQTQKSNTNPVPIVYGKHRIAGNIIYQTTNYAISGDDASKGYNRDYWAIIAVAGHDINTINKIYGGDEELTSLGSNKYESYGTQVKWYDASTTATSLDTVNFVTDTSGSESTGSTLGLDNITIPADVAYLAVHQIYDGQQNKNTQLVNITIELEGKEIRTITDASTISTATTYSTNPAEIVLDLLGDGLAIPDADIDIASFYDVKTKCNTNAWTCNLALIQQANIQSTIQDVLATCRGQIVHSENKWKLKIDAKSQTSVATLTDADIINNTLNMSMKGNREIANKIIVKYINPTDDWLSAQVVKESTDLQTLDGQTVEKVLDIKGITNATQAGELAEITLNTMRYTEDVSGNRLKQTPLAISFATSIKHANLEVGDLVSITHDLLDRTRKFMILSLETDQSGLIQITAREYAETHYKDSSGVYLI